MAKVCLECLEVYGNDNLKSNTAVDRDGQVHYVCPKKSCQGDIVEIDDVLLPTIVELNEKGYLTEECCAGHLEDRIETVSYIRFAPGIEIEESLLPKGFTKAMVIDEYTMEECVMISRRVTIMDEVKALQDIFTSGLQLFAWAKKLKSIDFTFRDITAFLLGEDFMEDYLEEEMPVEKKELKDVDLEKIKQDIGNGKSSITMQEFLSLKEKAENEKKD